MNTSTAPIHPHNPIARWLAEHGQLVLDGALGSELARRGADVDDPLWSAKLLLEQPSLIHQVHLDYFRAGADVATTATYQATFEGFARRGLDASAAAALMRSAVALATEAREQFWQEAQTDPAHAGRARPLVAASVGPYGAFLADGSEYRGHYGLDRAALRAFHEPRLAVLATAGADLLACETLPCLEEALALAEALQAWPEQSAWFSFSCRDGAHNSQGEPLADCVRALNAYPQVAAIGINCTAPQHVPALAAAARAATDKPIVVYPNAGETYDAVTKTWHGAAHDGGATMAEDAMRWAQAGARLIGGCCRTTPQDIAALRARWARPA
jgi:homocysteine S-methyltransferase